MIVVVDASVVLKWLLQDPGREPGTEKATSLMQSVAGGAQAVRQPVHWLAEVAAVLARESAETAADDVMMLSALELPTADEPLVFRRASELAIELRQHMFDTLYHAVALESEETDTTLITADQRYLRAARKKGRIVDLMDWK